MTISEPNKRKTEAICNIWNKYCSKGEKIAVTQVIHFLMNTYGLDKNTAIKDTKEFIKSIHRG